MSTAAASELRQRVGENDAPASPLREAAADFWLNLLFLTVPRARRIPRLLRPLMVRCGYGFSTAIRSATEANARRIFGPQVSAKQCRAFGLGVVDSFYDFVCDIGASLHLSREQIDARIESVEGEEHYHAIRRMRKGAIVATAHMGSFEVGAAALRRHERNIHVVFRRDPSRFEQVRRSLRQKLGVIEAPVDDGWGIWIRLRDALLRDEVVMVQGDRVMPGQKGSKVPFLHGHLLLPSGPVKLAMASGAPIIPVFAIRTGSGRIRIHVEPAIIVDASDGAADAAMRQFASVLEKYVTAYPEQWLLFHKAFCEDAGETA